MYVWVWLPDQKPKTIKIINVLRCFDYFHLIFCLTHCNFRVRKKTHTHTHRTYSHTQMKSKREKNVQSGIVAREKIIQGWDHPVSRFIAPYNFIHGISKFTADDQMAQQQQKKITYYIFEVDECVCALCAHPHPPARTLSLYTSACMGSCKSFCAIVNNAMQWQAQISRLHVFL